MAELERLSDYTPLPVAAEAEAPAKTEMKRSESRSAVTAEAARQAAIEDELKKLGTPAPEMAGQQKPALSPAAQRMVAGVASAQAMRFDLARTAEHVKALGIENEFTQVISSFAAEPKMQAALGLDAAVIVGAEAPKYVFQDGFNQAGLESFAKSLKSTENIYLSIAVKNETEATAAKVFLKQYGFDSAKCVVVTASIEEAFDAGLKQAGRNLSRAAATRISGASQLDAKTYGELLAGSLGLEIVVVTDREIAGIARTLTALQVVEAAIEAARSIAIAA